jgi:hypothetical protein
VIALGIKVNPADSAREGRGWMSGLWTFELADIRQYCTIVIPIITRPIIDYRAVVAGELTKRTTERIIYGTTTDTCAPRISIVSCRRRQIFMCFHTIGDIRDLFMKQIS